MTTTHQLIATGGATASIPLDTDAALAAGSDLRIATQKAVKAYITALLAGFSTPEGLVFPAEIVTASGVLPTASFIQLNSADAALEMTAFPTAGRLLVITQIDAGTSGHTVTLGPGTYDGTNDIATFNAAGETLILFGLTSTRFAIILNLGSVALSQAV